MHSLNEAIGAPCPGTAVRTWCCFGGARSTGSGAGVLRAAAAGRPESVHVPPHFGKRYARGGQHEVPIVGCRGARG
jgi:hypothetical protein